MTAARAPAAASSSASLGDNVEASRLAALLSFLQSWDYAAESLTQHALGERAGWAVVSILEVWKAACRLRLLLHVEQGRLMSSFALDEPQEETWSTVVRRVGASSVGLRERASARAMGREQPADSDQRNALRLVRVGEVMHVLQPVVYLLLIQLQRRYVAVPRGVGGATTSRFQLGDSAWWRHTCARRTPWLAALALEAGGLQLCALGLRRLERGRTAAAIASASDASDNARELRHRSQLLALFVVRPTARAAARRLLSAGVYRGHPRFARWCAAALDLVDTLETSLWARYFRTCERPWQLPAPADLDPNGG